jgi:hypothetical protein
MLFTCLRHPQLASRFLVFDEKSAASGTVMVTTSGWSKKVGTKVCMLDLTSELTITLKLTMLQLSGRMSTYFSPISDIGQVGHFWTAL